MGSKTRGVHPVVQFARALLRQFIVHHKAMPSENPSHSSHAIDIDVPHHYGLD